ncbi:MAG: redoxin domain-containing protein [Planctomycetota bacterium]
MNKLSVIALLLTIFLTGNVTATENAQDNATSVIGTRVVDLDGRILCPGINDGELKPVVIVLLDIGCPIARRYSPELNEYSQRADELGVELYGLLSDPVLSLSDAIEFRDSFELEFPVIWDSNGDLALRLAPTKFPECFVIAPSGEVVYRGRIDNRFEAPGKLRQNVTAHELRDAMTAVAEGRLPEVSYEPPVGCIFEGWTDSIPDEPDFNRHIAPIIYANCTSCHRDGEVAPFYSSELRTNQTSCADDRI